MDVDIEGMTAADLDLDKSDEMASLTDPIPDGVPDPALYRMILMPVSLPTKTKGGILLSAQTIEADNWNNMLARVVKLGPLCFQHSKYKSMGMTEPPISPGDLVMVTARVPFSWRFKGVKLIVVSDDQFFAVVRDESNLQDYSFR